MNRLSLQSMIESFVRVVLVAIIATAATNSIAEQQQFFTTDRDDIQQSRSPGMQALANLVGEKVGATGCEELSHGLGVFECSDSDGFGTLVAAWDDVANKFVAVPYLPHDERYLDQTEKLTQPASPRTQRQLAQALFRMRNPSVRVRSDDRTGIVYAFAGPIGRSLGKNIELSTDVAALIGVEATGSFVVQERQSAADGGEVLTLQQVANGVTLKAPLQARLLTNGDLSELRGELHAASDFPSSVPTKPYSFVRAQVAGHLSEHYALRSEIIDPPGFTEALAYRLVRNRIALTWEIPVVVGARKGVAIVEDQTGVVLIEFPAEYRTCAGQGNQVGNCDNPSARIMVQNGVCSNPDFCNGNSQSGTSVSQVHEAADQTVRDTISDLQGLAPSGAVPPAEPDIIVDSAQIAQSPAPAAVISHQENQSSPIERHIHVSVDTVLENLDTMTHEAVHIFSGAKNTGFRTTTASEAGQRALSEAVSYSIERIRGNKVDDLRHDQANEPSYYPHADDFNDFDPATTPAANQAVITIENSRIFERAIYEIIVANNGLDAQATEKLIARAIAGTTIAPNVMDGVGYFESFRQSINDVLEEYKDDDVISNQQYQEMRSSVEASFGFVGVGPGALPRNNCQSCTPTPPPAAPVFLSDNLGCSNGSHVYRLKWNATGGSTYYVIRDSVGFPQAQTMQTFIYLSIHQPGVVLTLRVHAGNSAGESGPSNSITFNYQCNF